MALHKKKLLSLDTSNPLPVLAQYLVTKITFWSTYQRILTVTASHLALFNPEDLTCTNQWLLSTITDIEIPHDPHQFILVMEKVRFQPHKLRFRCAARSHLIALLHQLRRPHSLPPLRINGINVSSTWRPHHYECSEHFADDSHEFSLLQIDLSGVTLLDENGHHVAEFPYLSIQRIAVSSAHPDALVISTLFQERLFLCQPRAECIEHMQAAAHALGVTLVVDQSPLNMQLLRLRNSQALDNPAVVCFDVLKVVDNNTRHEPIQLIFQGVALIEVHRKLRTIITRPYSMLWSIVLSPSDTDTVVLVFVQRETLVVRVDARDQFAALLLLVCREAGNEQVELSHAMIHRRRLFHPHITENVGETAGTSMESFFLRRLLRVLECEVPPSPVREMGGVTSRRKNRRKETGKGKGNGNGNRLRTRGLRANAVMMETRLAADTGATLKDPLSVAIALEELNANIPLTGFSDRCNRALLMRAIEALLEVLTSQVALLRSYIDAPTREIVSTLQALTRMAQSHHAFFAEDLVPALFHDLQEIILKRDSLASYWTLQLLQRYFEPRKGTEARRHRAKALETFVENRDLIYAILDLIPEASSLSTSSSGRWMRPGSDTLRVSAGNDSDAYLHQDLNATLLFTKEERLEKDLNILPYEALFTLHHVLIFLLTKEQQEEEAVVLIRSKTDLLQAQRVATTTDWTTTLRLDQSEYDLPHHENNLARATAAKRAIGDKLLSKHRFLMDAVVDVRLAKACQTIVALINFVVHIFHQELHAAKACKRTQLPPGGFVLYEDARADPAGTILYQVGSDTEYRRKRGTLPMRRSFLDDPTSPDVDNEVEGEAHERTLQQLFAFLECYQADVATLDNRSRLFPEQHTILLPLLSFSNAASTVSSRHSVFYVSGENAAETNARLRDYDEDFLTLDQLVFEEEEDENRHRKTVITPAEKKMRRKQTAHPLKPTRPTVQRSLSHPLTNNIHSIGLNARSGSPVARTSSSFVPHFMTSSNFRRLDAARLQTLAQRRPHPHPQPHYYPTEHLSTRGIEKPLLRPVKKDQSRTRPPALITTIDNRLSAHTCDACIACNDVCASAHCFFCAEKEYQLEIAFTDASSLPPSRSRSTHSATLSSSFPTERKYSSCEVRRHHTVRSCWVLVFGFVYDVTDLLSSHPGGMDVLLTAAAVGKDMGELFVHQHPPRARRVLENYYLGEYYHCENRTVLA